MLLRALIAMLMVTVFFQAESNAQLRHPVKSFNRLAGIWHGHGRHYRAPGPDVGYYNPYSAHNSGLVSEGYIPYNNYAMQNHSYMQNNGMQHSVFQPTMSQGIQSPSPFGGSYEKFEDEFDDGFEDSEDGNDAEPETQSAPSKKESETLTWKEYEEQQAKKAQSGGDDEFDFELPSDALNFNTDSQKKKK